MALAHFQRAIVNSSGDLQPGTVCTIVNESTGGLAPISSDRSGSTPKTNPVTVGPDGILDFYAAGGAYRITGVNGDFSFDWRYVGIGTAQEYDIDDLLIVGTRTPACVPYTFSTTTTDSDPGSGFLRLNNATPSSATQAFIDNNSSAGQAATAWLDSFDDGGTSSNRGYLHISDVNAPQNFRVYQVTGSVTDGTGYRKISITHLTGAGSFADNASLNVHFTPKGDTGSATSSADVAWSGDISPSSLSTAQDDYNPTGLSAAAVIRHAQSVEIDINGNAGGADGRLMADANISAYVQRQNAERASSTAANRLAGPDIEIDPGAVALRIYDSTSSRWRPVAPRLKPLHLHVTPDPFPTVPHKPTVYADWSTMPWLDRYFTFTRGSIGTYLDKKGILRTAAAGVPRFHTIYSSGETGLLIEGARTNLCLRSQEFGTTWTLSSGMSVSSDAAVAPDGTTTADKLLESSSSVTQNTSQGIAVTSGTTYTVSCYLKAAERGFALMALVTAFPTTSIQINLSTGAVTTGTGSPLNAFSEALPNGWWRVGFSLAATSTATASVNIYVSTDGVWANRIYTGTITSGIYVWGAQLEAGAFASSYIPTTSASVTRSADNLTRSNADGVINSVQGTLAVRWLSPATPASQSFASLYQDGPNLLNIRASSGSLFQTSVTVGGSQVASLVGGALAAGTVYKAAAAYATDDFQAYLNGVSVATDTAGAVPPFTSMGIGHSNGAETFFGIIQTLLLYQRRLSATHMGTITT